VTLNINFDKQILPQKFKNYISSTSLFIYYWALLAQHGNIRS